MNLISLITIYPHQTKATQEFKSETQCNRLFSIKFSDLSRENQLDFLDYIERLKIATANFYEKSLRFNPIPLYVAMSSSEGLTASADLLNPLNNFWTDYVQGRWTQIEDLYSNPKSIAIFSQFVIPLNISDIPLSLNSFINPESIFTSKKVPPPFKKAFQWNPLETNYFGNTLKLTNESSDHNSEKKNKVISLNFPEILYRKPFIYGKSLEEKYFRISLNFIYRYLYYLNNEFWHKELSDETLTFLRNKISVLFHSASLKLPPTLEFISEKEHPGFFAIKDENGSVLESNRIAKTENRYGAPIYINSDLIIGLDFKQTALIILHELLHQIGEKDTIERGPDFFAQSVYSYAKNWILNNEWMSSPFKILELQSPEILDDELKRNSLFQNYRGKIWSLPQDLRQISSRIFIEFDGEILDPVPLIHQLIPKVYSLDSNHLFTYFLKNVRLHSLNNLSKEEFDASLDMDLTAIYHNDVTKTAVKVFGKVTLVLKLIKNESTQNHWRIFRSKLDDEHLGVELSDLTLASKATTKVKNKVKPSLAPNLIARSVQSNVLLNENGDTLWQVNFNLDSEEINRLKNSSKKKLNNNSTWIDGNIILESPSFLKLPSNPESTPIILPVSINRFDSELKVQINAQILISKNSPSRVYEIKNVTLKNSDGSLALVNFEDKLKLNFNGSPQSNKQLQFQIKESLGGKIIGMPINLGLNVYSQDSIWDFSFIVTHSNPLTHLKLTLQNESENATFQTKKEIIELDLMDSLSEKNSKSYFQVTSQSLDSNQTEFHLSLDLSKFLKLHPTKQFRIMELYVRDSLYFDSLFYLKSLQVIEPE